MRWIICILLLTSTAFAGSPWWRTLETESMSVSERNRAFYKSLAKTRTPAKSEKPEKYILVIAPHPDDEILCCTSVIHNAVQQKKLLKIIYLTDGDAYSVDNNQASRNYGQTRRRESTLATKQLGVDPEDLIWLGFPDGILSQLDQGILTSPYTGQNKTAQKTRAPGTTYTQDNLTKLLTSIFETYPAESVYFPDENKDRHADHREAGELISNLIKPDMHHYRYVIHDQKFAPTPGFFDRTKASLINIFSSQFHDEAHQKFLERFAYAEENFE